MKKLFTYLAMAVLLIYLAITYLPIGKSLKSGEAAPVFQAELIDNSSFDLAAEKGNYILLDFWGSWCAPCIREAPKLVKLNKKFESAELKKGAEFKVVSVALEKSGDRWKKTAEKFGFDWPNQIVQHSNMVMMAPLARKFGVTNIPAKFLIYPDGTMRTGLTFEEMDQILTEQLVN